jgi:sugar fermentation stimulation protein A
MDYVKAIFKARPNRFIAEVEVDGKVEIAHVPNTGRCKELLVEDSVVG